MPADMTDINKMPLPGGNVNSPASGTYGEGVALERLKQQLPEPSAPPMPSGGGMPPMQSPGVRPATGAPAPGLPPALLAPTSRPNVPAATPLAPMGGQMMPATGQQRRMQLLDALATSPNVSDETREWAQLLMDHLIASSAR
jgi:hypothetical protein